jgi:hypothetical protein
MRHIAIAIVFCACVAGAIYTGGNGWLIAGAVISFLSL